MHTAQNPLLNITKKMCARIYHIYSPAAVAKGASSSSANASETSSISYGATRWKREREVKSRNYCAQHLPKEGSAIEVFTKRVVREEDGRVTYTEPKKV